MSERREGWYWIKESHNAKWEAAQWEHCQWCGDSEQFIPAVIGHRIPSPDEPWQCVPKEQTDDMYRRAYWHMVTCGGGLPSLWGEFLSAAPSPDDHDA